MILIIRILFTVNFNDAVCLPQGVSGHTFVRGEVFRRDTEYLQLHGGHVVLHPGPRLDPRPGRHRGGGGVPSHPVVDGGWEGLTLTSQCEVSSNAR